MGFEECRDLIEVLKDYSVRVARLMQMNMLKAPDKKNNKKEKDISSSNTMSFVLALENCKILI